MMNYQPCRNPFGVVVSITVVDDSGGSIGSIPLASTGPAMDDFQQWYSAQNPPPFSLEPALPEQWQPLIVELQQEAYAGLSDQESADALNARDQRGFVPLWEIDLYRVRNGLTIPLENAKTSHVSSDIRNAAAAAIAYLCSPHVSNIDLDDPDSAAMLLALEEGGVITTEQLQAIDSLADNRATRCEQLGLPPATASIVALARLSPPP